MFLKKVPSRGSLQRGQRNKEKKMSYKRELPHLEGGRSG